MPWDSLVVALMLTVLLAQGAIWYKVGRVESLIDSHLRQHEVSRYDPSTDPIRSRSNPA